MSEALDDSGVNHGKIMQEGMEEKDTDECLKSLQAGQQVPTYGVQCTWITGEICWKMIGPDLGFNFFTWKAEDGRLEQQCIQRLVL